MSIYHYSVQVISRGAGRSVVAAAAYRSASTIIEEISGLTHDYSAKGGVVYSEIFAPNGAPAWATDRAQLWNEVEAGEKRKDAQTAREIVVALPKELGDAQRIELLRNFVHEQFVARGMVADVNIHADDANNPHAHILLTLRSIGPQGFGLKSREWNSKTVLQQQREAWALHTNRALERAGVAQRVDHRSLRAQGIERTPTFHLGAAVTEMEARGLSTQKGENYRKVVELNTYRERKSQRDALVTDAIAHLVQQHSTFTEKSVARYVTKRARSYLGSDELTRVVSDTLVDPRVVHLGKDENGVVQYSTQELLSIEKTLLRQAQAMGQTERHLVHDGAIRGVLQRHSLTVEQEAALRHITGPAQLTVVEGRAGTGKTYLLRAAREAWEVQGYEVRGAALAGKAADGLREGAGIPSQTIHGLLSQIERGQAKLSANTVLVIDEAGMVGSRQLARVVQHADLAGAKIVAVGDSRQLQPIDAGGGFRLLSEHLGHAELNVIVRQKEEWAREAVRELADGKAREALARFQEHGLLTIAEDRSAATLELIAHWKADRLAHPLQTQLITAATNKEVHALNEHARAIMKEQGALTSSMILQVTRGRREFAEGDRIIFTRNEYNELDVRNGTLGSVQQILYTHEGNKLSVKLDDGRDIVVNPKTYTDFDHGYARTVHKAQGDTVDRSYVLVGRWHDREMSYVAGSRARLDTRLYVSRGTLTEQQALKHSAQQMATSHQKTTTLDYPVLEKNDVPEWYWGR